MNCIEFRRVVMSEPNRLDADAQAHLDGCELCTRHTAQLREFDAKLLEAMRVGVPDDLAARVSLKVHGAERRRNRWFALAASVVLVAGLASGTWFWLRGGDLHDHVIAHVYHEPELLVHTDQRTPAYDVLPVLNRGNVSLKGDIGEVIHSRLCFFRGNLVAHLVVPGEHGPVTVMLLPDEQVEVPEPVNEEGFRGTIFPVGKGSVAVVGMEEELTEKIEQKFSQAVEWTI